MMEKKGTILIVDDEENIRDILFEVLSNEAYECHRAEGGEEALSLLGERSFELVLSDILMPGMSGIDLLKEAKAADADLSFIMVTAVHAAETAIEAMRLGADNYLIKPFNLDEVILSVEKALQRRRLIIENREYQLHLEKKVEERTRELHDALKKIQASYRATLEALGSALDTRDIGTHAHSRRVTHYALLLGRTLGMSGQELEVLERGVYLHDIGKIGIPDDILLRPGKLTKQEMEIMMTHAELGKRLLSRIDFLREASEIVYSHQERFDGSGYPRGLKGEEIPLGARVFAIVDALDAMTSDRPYRKALPFEAARAEIIRSAGIQFDPEIVRVFMSIPKEQWLRVRERPLLYEEEREVA
ncbi:MAG: response regulator [Candidatus Manganitrophus sp. SB1]|nr:response regulator [Candidatus Manganitrophus morganii]